MYTMTQPDLHVFHRVVYKMKRTYSGGRFTVYYVKITLLCKLTLIQSLIIGFLQFIS